MAPVAVSVSPPFDDQHTLYSGSVFPAAALEGCETALCLFSAAYLGRQDAYWVARAGLDATCVDIDGAKLDEMKPLYPSGWGWAQADVFEWAEMNRDNLFAHWDVVTLDPFTGLFERCANELPLWCSLANKSVVLGHGNYRLTRPAAPDGWTMTDIIKRSDFKGGVYWLVFQRD